MSTERKILNIVLHADKTKSYSCQDETKIYIIRFYLKLAELAAVCYVQSSVIRIDCVAFDFGTLYFTLN